MCAGKGPLPALQTAPSFTLDESGQKYIGPVQKQRSKEQAAEKEEKEKIKDVRKHPSLSACSPFLCLAYLLSSLFVAPFLPVLLLYLFAGKTEAVPANEGNGTAQVGGT